MESAQNDDLDFLVPSLELEQPIWIPSPTFKGVTEDRTTRIFLKVLKEHPDIWKNILSQKQNRRDNPGWEDLRRQCNLKDVNETRKYYETIKKDMVRRIDMAIKKNTINYNKLSVDGLDKLREYQSNYKYWDDAEFLAKHVIFKRVNYDLDSRPTVMNLDTLIGDIKTETEVPENQHQCPAASSAQSTTFVVDEENSCLIETTEVFPRNFDIQSIKQEEPIDVSQMQAGPSSPENLEESSVIVEDFTTLIDIKHERSDIDDMDSSQAPVRLIMSGIECSATTDSGNLPTSTAEDVNTDDMGVEMEMNVDESTEEMLRRRAEAKERALQLFMERICELPTEEISPGQVLRFGIYGHKMQTLASQGLGREEFDHELKTFKFE